MDIFRLNSRPNPFRGVQICPHPNPDIQHPIPYPYPNTQITYLLCRYLIVSYPAWLTLSVFKSKSEQNENKCDTVLSVFIPLLLTVATAGPVSHTLAKGKHGPLVRCAPFARGMARQSSTSVAQCPGMCSSVQWLHTVPAPPSIPCFERGSFISSLSLPPLRSGQCLDAKLGRRFGACALARFVFLCKKMSKK
jgi:hypothetical protein